MTVKIIGSNTINGLKLKRVILKVANSFEEKIIITFIDDLSHNDLPILYINNHLISKGFVLNEKEIVKHFKNNIKE